jgi:hypothetical protein
MLPIKTQDLAQPQDFRLPCANPVTREKGFTVAPCYRIARHGVTPMKDLSFLPHRA